MTPQKIEQVVDVIRVGWIAAVPRLRENECKGVRNEHFVRVAKDEELFERGGGGSEEDLIVVGPYKNLEGLKHDVKIFDERDKKDEEDQSKTKEDVETEP